MLRRRSLRVTIQMVAFVTSLGVLTPTTAVAQTQNLNLAWDPPGTADVNSYRVYVGTAPSAQDAGVYTIPASQVSYGFAATPGVLYYFAVSAVSAAGVEGPRSATVSGAIPLLSLLANRTSTVGVPIDAVQLTAYDPDGGTLRFTHTGLPPGLVLNATTGLITGTPLSTGTCTVTVFASDGLLTNSRSFDWTVRSSGSEDTTAPRISITTPTPGQSVLSSVTVSGTATDNGLGDSGIARVTVNGQLASSGTASGSGTANWSRTVTLSGTSSTILVEAVDGAGNSAAELITVNRAAAQLTVTSLTSNLASPQPAGTTVRFTASAAGGTAPYQFKWWVLSGGVWYIAQNWSSSATLNWQPTSSGTYTIAVWARNAGVTADASQALAQVPYVVSNTATSSASASLSITSLTSDVSSPSVVGTEITFAATAAGGSGVYEFKWWIQSGGTWSILRDWHSARTLLWQPTTAGSYVIAVWARNTGVTIDASQALAQMSYVVSPRTTSTTTTALSITGLSSNLASPQAPGTSITFSSGATGGTAPYQFKWWVLSNGVWTVGRDWSTSTSFTWRPWSAGTYVVAVWARNAGVTADASQATAQVSYVISATGSSSAPLSITSFTSDLSSPQPRYTFINFSTVATGGTGEYQFKWWIQSGGVWSVLRDWDSRPMLEWFPRTAGSYVIAVWARNVGSTTDASEALAQAPFVISP
jgi:hypothetical protein